jgi:DNA gyrase subunit B
MAKKSEYSAKDISVLKGLDPVRKRPGMYIGSTDVDGLHHLIWECVDNFIDEFMGGYGKEGSVTLHADDRVEASDDGRGIPVDKHKETGRPAVETVMTTLHAGAKFGSKAYQVSGGLHGVGISVVCALSEWMRVEISRDGYKHCQEYKRGVPTGNLKKGEKTNKTGTTVIFQPDKEIFKDITFNAKKILSHLRQQAYLTKGIKINFSDERGDLEKKHSFYFEGGISSYVKYLTRGIDPIHSNVFYCTGERDGVLIEASFRYSQEYEIYEESFANNINTKEGGTHLTGFRVALTKTINNYAKREGLLKENEDNLKGEDIREGLTSVVSVKIREPQFEGQTKAKLGNAEARPATESLVSEHIVDFFERNPQDARAIIGKCILSAKARKAARAVRETVLRKGVLEGLSLPGKLADCSTKKPEESELYIVEGESAGGCFSGDTKIALVDGRNLSFKDLVEEEKQGKKNYCYTVKKDGKIGIEMISYPRKTKKNVNVIKIILDNDEEIVCTPDHKFMLRDGSYKEAKNLNNQDSLMPLRRKFSEIGRGITIKGYEMVFENKEEKMKEAVLNYNHKIKRIIKIEEKIDVYDIEVKETHNFALSSGVFVHNSCKGARDRRFQAILPLKGKILNVERYRLNKILESKEVKALVIALGTAIAEDFDIERLRYHRVIIMCDADSDGNHIKTLLLTLFFRHFKPLIEKGYIYIARPPLYKIQSGKRIEYAYMEEDKAEILEDIKSDNIDIQRYKGLGEMNPIQLWETTMNPENRMLLQVTIEDAKEADRVFDALMGQEVALRKNFIKTHAKEVGNLDI